MKPDLTMPAPEKTEDEGLGARQHTQKEFTRLNDLLEGKLSFGDGTDNDNILGKWVSYTTSGGEDAITHNLGVVPLGFILIKPPEYGFICKSPTTAWNTTTLYLWCGEPNQSVTIFVIVPPTHGV